MNSVLVSAVAAAFFTGPACATPEAPDPADQADAFERHALLKAFEKSVADASRTGATGKLPQETAALDFSQPSEIAAAPRTTAPHGDPPFVAGPAADAPSPIAINFAQPNSATRLVDAATVDFSFAQTNPSDARRKVDNPAGRGPQGGERRRADPTALRVDPAQVGDGGAYDAGSVQNPGAVDAPRLDEFPDCRVSNDTFAFCWPAVPDRWRLAENLGVIKTRWWDPYSQNTLKGDRPIRGTKDWFFVASVISDTVIEPRSFPIPVGVQTTDRPGSLDVFGDGDNFVFSQNLITSLSLIKGSTAYKPQDLEFRLTPVFNYNYASVEELRILHVEPSEGTTRSDGFVGIQEAFVDYHLRNVSDRYDFDSIRVGIQPFSSDFRGFLFQDNQLGFRLFGNRDNNRYQYNLGAFVRLEKDTNSGLNKIEDRPRKDYVFVANLYRQDLPLPGLTSQVTVLYNLNRESDDIEIDTNGFPVRPALIGNLRGRDYDVVYLGYNADGRAGRLNITASAYYALGEDRNSIFTDEPAKIRSFFAAVEPSYDRDWARFRLSGLFASGDGDPFDNVERGFDAIFENPQFAGADTSYWVRQPIPFIGGGRVIGLNGRNGVLPDLRSSKEQGQSNFNNPGLILAGVGADFDVLPPLRISFNANHLWFHKTDTLEALRVQGAIDNDIGWDISSAVIYRPKFIQNLVFRLSGAALVPSDGFRDLFDSNERDDLYYSVLFNAVLSY